MSSGANQRTLFQSWGASLSQNKVVQPKTTGKKAATGQRRATLGDPVAKAQPPPRSSLWGGTGQGSASTSEVRIEEPVSVDNEEEDDDDLMLVAVYEAEKTLELGANFVQDNNPLEIVHTSLSPTPSGGRCYPDFPGFDSSSAKVWIYPTNYPIREYQLKISETALFQNTLVCLPTGLGKTFIASVVMYNFYRWYPSGKIVFMAPTKPLVAQQIEACYKVMGIPQTHMAELTGSTAAGQRQELWRSKRVFFLTPQVMVNDLSRDTCPALQVKCVVIDEAHKALGNHAYCQVVRQLGSQTRQFRILALSATPGGDTRSVQQVISNLLISHIELRSDESPDIQAYSHQRSVEKVVVPLGETLAAHQARYVQVLERFMSRLVQNRLLANKDLRTLTKYQLILAREQFRKNPSPHIKGPQQGMLEGDFALCISLYHGYELLLQMGLRSLFFYIQGIMDGAREMSRARNELQRTPIFMDLYKEMEAMFVKPSAGPDEPFIYSHPKLHKLEEVVLQHFRQWAESSQTQEVSTRVMIFSSFRESVQEIAAMLNRHTPLIKVMTFMGQASTGNRVKGFTQKEQLEVMHRFRQGGFNTLVSTCVGEEGLDIGEVDLIVCFDAQKSPIRLVQRMGRTGRKRQGRIVVILAEGREERTYNQSQSNKSKVYKSIIGSKNSFQMYPNSPRMLPEGVNPTLHKMHITCGQFDHQDSSRRSSRGRRSLRSVKSDGFLTPTEFSLWASTMKLEEDEAHPTLSRSHFLSIPGDLPPQEVSNSGHPSRELSLWEWRHWQNRALPTSSVDHSLRCQHFVSVMELIDRMREENEVRTGPSLAVGLCPPKMSSDTYTIYVNKLTKAYRNPALRRGGRHFLDEEAELSEEDAGVSSDEEDGEDQNQSLEGFVVDNSHFSQGLNDSDMHGVYLKSVRSPAVAGKFKMVYRKQHDMDIFSQVEEMESSEEEAEDDVMELIPEDSYVDGKKQYTTRRRALLRKNRAQVGAVTEQRAPQTKAGVKTKRSRIIRINDSSEEETEQVVKESRVMPNGDVAAPLRPKAVQQDLATSKPTLQQKAPSSCPTIAAKVSLLSRAQRGSFYSFKASTSTSDSTHQPQKPIGPALSTGESPAPSGLVSVLVDSRCISGGAELVSSLRQRHAATVHICSLDGNYFIVSSRMAVERHSQSDLAAMQNRKRLAERVNSLQGLFERVCLVVEKDRTKPGEASRPFQRTRYYDSMVAALVRTGVRLLWSNGPEESAGLLADLARLEQRKGHGIAVPLEVKGQHRQQALQFYLSLPSVNYVHALNMIHNFRSIAHLINSSIEAIQKGGCMSRSRAEEIYRCLRYSCDSFLINTVTATKNS
uniref:ATP-dependent RNA helicase FANCM n=1 Tax=Myripristis murdjan TaxID=586833 RepID=A0A668A683_9TELE